MNTDEKRRAVGAPQHTWEHPAPQLVKPDYVRVLRLVSYEGPRDKVEEQVRNSLHGTRVGRRNVLITAVTLDVFPRVLDEASRTAAPDALADLLRQIESLEFENRLLRGI